MKNSKRIAVIGGGIFGCTSAFILARGGYQVELFEQEDSIFSSTSSINQYRLHRGYHYPRSKETAESSKDGERAFLNLYGEAVFSDKTENYYCIAKNESKVTASEYLDFLNGIGLKYKEKNLDFLVNNSLSLTVQVDEKLFNPYLLKSICQKYLDTYGVCIHLNTIAKVKELDEYDYIVNATYSNLNFLLPPHLHKQYQFELCEKPVVKLPKEYKNQSVVVMDGPFTCIDPLKGTPYHVMGNVTHAIHNSNIGIFPDRIFKFEGLLNKGVIKNPSVSNIDKFYKTARVFFKNVNNFEHIGSMFTYRAVLPNRGSDDARPTLVDRAYKNIYTIFSGKVGTCVDAAEELLHQIDKDAFNRE